ncbi:MAG TPA: kelch repeat-containing protein [Terriglobia bacterium]|nr:kelch repeat-containing protein [Terriglobia bacterium]
MRRRLWDSAAILGFALLLLNARQVLAASPTISSISPTSGAIGTSVTVSGSNFGSSQGSSEITFNGTVASPKTWTSTKIVANAPSGATTGNVIVTVSGVASNGKSFTVKPTPTITSVSPSFGAVEIMITITGTNFGSSQGSSTVKFNGTAGAPKSWSPSQIIVPVPNGATTGNVVVHASGIDVNGGAFTVETLASITVTPPNFSLPLNSVQQYTATANYSDGSHQNLTANAAWSSSDTSAATISMSGVLNALLEGGQATIQASFGSSNGSTTVSITGPTFIPVGNLLTGRDSHTATLLPNGKVLIVGGEDASGNILAAAELYDPATGTFFPTGSLGTARMSHTATLMQNGKVLITGGINTNFSPFELASAELYDPSTGTFTYTGIMNSARAGHTAALLNNGMVLIAGGNDNATDLATAELYDPNAGTFTPTGSLLTARENHTATLLGDGTVLVAGGATDDGSSVLSSAEIYNPSTGTFAATGSLNTEREFHTATLLNGGKLIVAGGYNNSAPYELASIEIYDPTARTFTTSTNMAVPREGHTATLLADGSVLIVGGGNNTEDMGTAELLDPTGQTLTGTGALNTARFGHSATLLNDGTVLIVGGEGGSGSALASAELYAPTPPPPYSLQVTPSAASLTVGDTRQFTAVDSLGHPRSDVTWSVSDTSVATITSDSSPILTALAPGQVSLTATDGTVSAQAQVTISAAGLPPVPGTPAWSAPSVSGFSPLQLIEAAPSNSGPDLYLTQSSSDGTESFIQAFTLDGQQMWQSQWPAMNGSSVPDAFGGLLVTEHQTCNQGQTDPMTIVDMDAVTGQPLWQITAQGLPGQGPGGSTLYCYSDAPEIAIRGDGAVVISAPGNTSGLPEIQIVDGQTGQLISEPDIPQSSYINAEGSNIPGYSPIGPPIVDSSGSVYVEYEVRTITAVPLKVTSAAVYLLQVALDGSTTTTELSSTSENENLFPGRIIPDGQGGVLATWSVDASPIPTNPYQAAYVVSGVVSASYDLPFTPSAYVFGPDSLPLNPSLVLGENGVAFATDGTSSGDSNNPGMGPKIVSFNLATGTVNWTYQVGTQAILSLIASTSGGGVVAKSTLNGVDTVLRFDSSGNATPDNWTSSAISNYGGDLWLGYSSTGPSEYYADPVELSTSPWYGPDGNGGNAAIQDVSITNFSQTGANQTEISGILQKIETALPSNAGCNSWLQGAGQFQGLSGVQQVQNLISTNYFGHGTVNLGTAIDYMIAAFSGSENPDKTPVAGLPTSGVVFTVNDVGAFFNQFVDGDQGKSFQVGTRKYAGNSLRAQATVLIHEVAHQITVSGFQKDFGNPKAEKANDKAVDANCRQLIEGLQ